MYFVNCVFDFYFQEKVILLVKSFDKDLATGHVNADFSSIFFVLSDAEMGTQI